MVRLRFIWLLLFLPFVHSLLNYASHDRDPWWRVNWRIHSRCDPWRSGLDGVTLPSSWLGTIVNNEVNYTTEIVSITRHHLITAKEVVTTIDKYGREQMVSPSSLAVRFKESEFPVTDIVIPASNNATTGEINLFNLAILQVNASFNLPDVICPPHRTKGKDQTHGIQRSFDSNVNNWQFHYESHMECKEAGCDEILKRNKSIFIGDDEKSAVGAPWVSVDDQYVFRLIGIGINETAAINIRFWGDFICKLTGSCTYGYFRHNSLMRSEYSYVQNGDFVKNDCSEDSRVKLIKESTPFTPLTKEERSRLKTICGRPPLSEGRRLKGGSSWVLIISKIECGYGNKCESKERMCTGTLISSRHVITSADCIKSIDIAGGEMHIIYPEEQGISVGMRLKKQYMDMIMIPVEQIVVPPTESRSGAHDEIVDNIALLQLRDPIPEDTLTYPICMGRSLNDISEKCLHLQHVIPQTKTLEQQLIESALESNPVYVIYKDTRDREYQVKKEPIDLTFESCNHGQYCPLHASSHYEHIDLGSPLICFSKDNGKGDTLYGISHSNGSWTTDFIRVSHFSTFICIHTGICDGSIDYEELPLLPYNEKDVDLALYFVEQHIQSKLKSQRAVQWNQGISINREIDHDYATSFRHLNRLSSTEYEETREDCGKESPLMARIRSKVDWKVLNFTYFSEITNLCHGALISRRHVLTSVHCILDWQTWDDLNVEYGDPGDPDEVFLSTGPLYTNFKKWDHSRKVKNVIYGGRTSNRFEFDLAVLELESDIEPRHFKTIPCVRDYKDIREIRSYSSIVTLNVKCDSSEHDEYDYHSIHYGIDEFYKHDWEINQEIGFGKVEVKMDFRDKINKIDVGSPLIGDKMRDGRYIHYGTLKRTEGINVEYLPTYSSLGAICRMSGVCPRNPEWDAQLDFYVQTKKMCQQLV